MVRGYEKVMKSKEPGGWFWFVILELDSMNILRKIFWSHDEL